jgi:hypothetical protein
VVVTISFPQSTVLNEKQADALKGSGLAAVPLIYLQPKTNTLQGKTLAQTIEVEGGDSLPVGRPITATDVGKIRSALPEGAQVKVQESFPLATTAAGDLVGKTLAEAVEFEQPQTLAVGTQINQLLAQQIVASGQADQQIAVLPLNPPYELSEIELPVAAGQVQLCTNFGEFKRSFGDFSTDDGQNTLAHAVYGFFRNGGTRCYVVRIAQASATDVDAALEAFEAIDEIAIVAAPGFTDRVVLDKIDGHCQSEDLRDRVAIFDSPETASLSDPTLVDQLKPFNSNYAALYFPWLQVFDPATKIQNPQGDGLKYVPPSGHMAGIYARVDAQRGVHKAPANVSVVGAVGLRYPISKRQQQSLNPVGVNCIRDLNGNIRVWGARTLGGDDNGEFKYISVRRLFNFLRESIDEGTQWIVFEPNTPDLWAKITRNINAFLTTVWSSGALFGNTPEEAFYVKCDAETNPPEVRDAGQVITEIGVAVTKPAEFVIFRVRQWAGPGGS